MGLRSTRSGEAIPDDVVARLGPVVLRTFSEVDFHRVDMRTIAKEAGMSFTTIYKHFVDKEALLFWFIDHWTQELYGRALKVIDSEEDALTKLQQFFSTHLEFYQEKPEVGRVIFMTVPLVRWMNDETYRTQEPSRRILKVIAEGQARGEIRGDVSKVDVFDLWSGIFNRAFLMWQYRGRSYSLLEHWEPLCRVALDGIAGPAAKARLSARAPQRHSA